MTDIKDRLAPVIAHRGASGEAPENTLAALRRAAALGAKWVEFDVKLSRDGACILMHDELLRRTTNGRGEVRRYDLDELRRLDAGAWFNARYAGERIPTLEEALALCLDLGLDINLEIKPCPGRQEETALRVIEVLRAGWPAGRPWPLISSFALVSLETVRLKAPELPRGLLVGRPTRRALALLDRLDCASLHCDARRLAPGLIEALRPSGRPLLTYTVNDAAQARRLIRMGVTAVFSDRPGEIAAVLAGSQ